MSQFEFTLATPDDDAELRRVLAGSPMEGRLSLAFAREPSYFSACAVDGKNVQVGIARDRTTSRVVGMGSRAIGPRYVNERSVPVGYLSGLRVLPEYRGRTGLLARGYRFLRALHEDGQTDFYLTTIASDNAVALQTLTSGRAGLPAYHPLGEFVTLSICPAHVKARLKSTDRITTRLATLDDQGLILQFLNSYGPQRQFFPAYEPDDLFTDGGLLQGLQPSDIVLAFRDHQLVGTLGAWDQGKFKQLIVHSYGGWLKRGRRLYNLAAALRRRPTLPPAGSTIETIYGAICVVAGDDPPVFRRLVAALTRGLAQRGANLFLLGLHNSDPLLPLARTYAGREYLTRLYFVYWPDRPTPVEPLQQRVPYLELGCL